MKKVEIDKFICYENCFLVIPKMKDHSQIIEMLYSQSFDEVQQFLASKEDSEQVALDYDIPKVYNGFIVPARYIPKEVKSFGTSTVWFLMDLIDKNFYDEDPNAYWSIEGSIYYIEDSSQYKDKSSCGPQQPDTIYNFITSVVNKNYCNIEEVFLFMGYELKPYIQLDDSDVDEEIISNLEPISDKHKTMLEKGIK